MLAQPVQMNREGEVGAGLELVEQTTPGQVRFVHPLFAQALYDDLPGPMRARLHARSFEYMRLSDQMEGHISNFHRTIDAFLRGLPHEALLPAIAVCVVLILLYAVPTLINPRWTSTALGLFQLFTAAWIFRRLPWRKPA